MVGEVYEHVEDDQHEPYHRVLAVDVGDGGTRHFPLTGDLLIIGRAPDAGLQIERNSVSRHHAEMFRDPFGRWWIRDLDSRNGTKVNGFQVKERMLDLSDRIMIGNIPMMFSLPRAVAERQEETLSGGTDVAVSDENEESRVVTLDSTGERSNIAALHLSDLMKLGEELQSTEQEGSRYRLLCEMFVDERFHGISAIALRIHREDSSKPPQALCEAVYRGERANGQTLQISRTLLQAIRQRPAPALASEDRSKRTNIEYSGIGSSLAAMACPFRVDEEEIDLLYVTLPRSYGNDEWLMMASLGAEHFRLAQNAWVARRQAKINAQVEHDLERARDIQVRLLPKALSVPQLDVAVSFKPCRWVAGDYVDTLTTADGRTLMIVADVCGKGLSAALVASSMHTLVHSGVRAGVPMVELAVLINDYLCEYLPSNRFVTAILVQYDAVTGDFEFINAGHPAPIMFSADGQADEVPLNDDEPFGIHPATFALGRGQLEPGRMLAMFTDGLTELRDRSGRMLTTERLRDHIRTLYGNGLSWTCRHLADELDLILDRYQANRLQSDDRTFLLAKRLLK